MCARRGSDCPLDKAATIGQAVTAAPPRPAGQEHRQIGRLACTSPHGRGALPRWRMIAAGLPVRAPSR